MSDILFNIINNKLKILAFFNTLKYWGKKVKFNDVLLLVILLMFKSLS